MFINSISASKSDIIDQCLWKYNLKYNLKIPGFGSKNEDALQFGSFIHKVLELGYKEKSIKTLLEIANENKKAYHIPESENNKIKICLENFLLWNNNIGETIATEGEVDGDLDKVADIKFVGIIDRIVKGSKGGILVIDYKTSKREKKKSELLDDKQLKGYAYAIHEKYKVPYKDIWCAHFYPITGNYIPVQFTEIQILMWKKKEIDKVWRIRKKTKDQFPAQQNIFCSNCEFTKVCPKFCTEKEVQIRLDEQLELRDKLREEKENKVNKESKNEGKTN